MTQESKGTIRVDLREVQDQLLQVDEDLRNSRFRIRMLWLAEIMVLLVGAGVGACAYVYSWFTDAASVRAIV
ncbi:MAG TPA: hypothetical protein VGX23_09515, partial [Actinocrinis sp.]|nr:hypothetical protein [Actinocrinis sp.]